MNSTLPAREIEIGQRLRAFRELKRIPRTAFALSIGIGGERLASYESGRVPLRFEIFKAINQLYFLDPLWLATGEGTPVQDRPFQLGEKESGIPPRATFSEAYESHLGAMCKDRARVAKILFEQAIESWDNFAAFLKKNPNYKLPPEVETNFRTGAREALSQLEDYLSVHETLDRHIKKLAARKGRASKK